MKTTKIRTKLHHFIDTMDDKKVKAIYTMFENDIEEEIEDYTDEFKAELDRRYEEYKKDGGTGITHEEMNERIKELMNR